MVKRGEVWLVVLDPTVGREIQKTRPCVIISPPEINDHLATVLVAPITTGSHPAPFRVPLTFHGKAGLILLEQSRSIDKARLAKHLGRVSEGTMIRALSVLQAMFSP